MKQPDILFIMTDQFNPRFAGYAGDEHKVTPNIDRLASEGTVFNNCYSVCPVCVPARASIVSGLYPHQHGLWTNKAEFEFPVEMSRLFKDLQNTGYYTGHIGKCHWFEGGLGSDFRDMDHYYKAIGLDFALEVPGTFGTPGHKSEYTDYLKQKGLLKVLIGELSMLLEKGQYYTEPSPLEPDDQNDGFTWKKAVEFLENYKEEKPYCLHVSFPGPHTPINASGKYADLVKPDDISLPASMDQAAKLGKDEYGREYMKKMTANYYGKIAQIDDYIGSIIDTIKKHRDLDNTLVIFTSDHGEMMGFHSKLSKCSFYEESANVPFVIRWPEKVKPGIKTDALMEITDIYPTLIQAAGGTVSQHCDAESIMPVATGEKEKIKDAAFSEFWGNSKYPEIMVRTEKWKWFYQGKDFLFDMQNDPFELKNLASDTEYAEIIKDLKEKYIKLVNKSYEYKPFFSRMNLNVEGDIAEQIENRFLDIHFPE